jgi:hypothetical protein
VEGEWTGWDAGLDGVGHEMLEHGARSRRLALPAQIGQFGQPPGVVAPREGGARSVGAAESHRDVVAVS